MNLKLQLLAFVFLASVAASHAQGTIAFLNPPTVIFPVPTDATVNYGIFIGPTADTLSEQPAGPLATGSPTSPGRMTGVPAVYQLPGTQAGEVYFAQVRAWDSAFGSDWRAARCFGRYYGETDIRQLDPLGPTAGPGTVIWQSAAGTSPHRFFALTFPLTPPMPPICIPEPNAWALLVLSGLLLGVGRWCFFGKK